MIMEKVLAAARPYLEGRMVADLVVGLSLIGVQLDNGAVGISYVLRDNLPHGCSAFPLAQQAIGKSALEIGSWYLSGADDLQRGVASAVLCAASQGVDCPDEPGEDEGLPFGLQLKEGDTVGMIGLITPIAKRLGAVAKQLYVFDKGLEQAGGNPLLTPCNRSEELLPQCDVVVFSGTTTINGSVDDLLTASANAREIVLVGSSTPMFPAGWQGSGVTRLAGSWWKNENKEEIFKGISLACGIDYLRDYMLKKAVPV